MFASEIMNRENKFELLKRACVITEVTRVTAGLNTVLKYMVENAKIVSVQ